MVLRMLCICVFAVLMAMSFAPSVFACKVDESGFSSGYRDDLNMDLNDYGRIHYDANLSTCAEAAGNALKVKIQNTFLADPYAFQDWLSGAQVALIFAAALRVGYYGYGTRELDEQVRRVATAFSLNPYIDPYCDDTGNQCLDDFSVAASGHAWIAAYRERRMDEWQYVNSAQRKAKDYMNYFFAAACVHTSANGTVFCDGSVLDLYGGDGMIRSMNHGQQVPSYGFGLITSIASATAGLKAAGLPVSFTNDEKHIAAYMATEMQENVDASTNPDRFTDTCWRVGWSGGMWIVSSTTEPCGGPAQYKPQMYALNAFYNAYLGGWGGLPGSYDSTVFDRYAFDLGATSSTFFSFGRYETYYRHAYSWIVSPPQWMPRDYHEPIGFLEQISSTGVAQGWTCDKDIPERSNVVEIFADGVKVTAARAESSSEEAIATECRGGYKHRFWVQLPTSTRGKNITAEGVDYTWFGRTQLACLQSPACKW